MVATSSPPEHPSSCPKAPFQASRTSGRTSPQGAAAKPGGNFKAIELTLIFKVIPKESQEGTVGQISCLEGEIKQKPSIYKRAAFLLSELTIH